MGIEVCQVFVSVDLDTALRLRPHLFPCNKSSCFCLCYSWALLEMSSVKTRISILDSTDT